MNVYETWVGASAKVGGTLFIPGMENMSAIVTNCGKFSEVHDFQILSVRLGLGLGGGVGTSLVFVFNCLNLWDLNGKTQTDWGVNVAVGDKLDGVAKFLANVPKTELKAALNLFKKTKNLPHKNWEQLRNLASLIYSADDTISRSSSPRIVSFDIPGAGIGLELSAHYLEGTVEVLS